MMFNSVSKKKISNSEEGEGTIYVYMHQVFAFANMRQPMPFYINLHQLMLSFVLCHKQTDRKVDLNVLSEITSAGAQ